MSLLNDLPDATFLVTSRSRLRIRGERVFDVEPLALPPDPARASIEAISAAPAVRLFLDRARAADPRFELTAENADDIARICRALEGVPLAIELAAARIRALTPAAMLSRLDRMLPLLVTAARDIPERQRTIQATVEWSIDLLSPDARALFVRLGVFAGDFSLDAVEAVTPARRGRPTCSSTSSSSSTAASCASTTMAACRSSRCSCRCARSRRPASNSSRMPRPCAVRTASTTSDSPPRSSRSCRARRSPTRWRGSRPNGTTSVPPTAT